MSENNFKLNFLGKVIIEGDIRVLTGLRIAGPTTGLKIGGVDQPVIYDAFGRPYIPGSSLKGKLRSLLEKKENVPLNRQKNNEPYGHECNSEDSYKNCSVCKVFGVLSSEKIKNTFIHTRIIIRDIFLDEKSITEEMRKNMELQYTEVKMEVAMDRYKGSALHGSLRTIDRVPAGAIFSPMEIIYNVYEDEDKKDLIKVFEAMKLLEDDYLGGMGSRGYGKIKFENLNIFWNKKEDYEEGNLRTNLINDNHKTPEEVIKNFESIKAKINGGEK